MKSISLRCQERGSVSSHPAVPTPIDQAWKVLADHAGMSQWGPVKVVVEKPGAPERDGVGAVRRISAPGPAPAIVEEITAFDAPTRLGYKALAGVPFGTPGSTNLLHVVTLTGDELAKHAP